MSGTKIDNAYTLNFYADGVEPLTVDIYATEWSDEYGLAATGDILDTVRTDGRGVALDFDEDWVTATVTEHGVGLELPAGVDLNAEDMDKLARRLVRLHNTEEVTA